jgi:hypothetical protein
MSGERTEMRRPAVEMAAAMMPPAEMVAVTMTTTAMAAAMMTATATTAVAATMATFRDRKVRYRQHRCEDNRGNSQSDF